MIALRLLGCVLTLPALTGCAWWFQAKQDAPGRSLPVAAFANAAGTREVPVTILPLPGALDDTLVFNSNSPEVVTEPGIALSTMPLKGAADRDIHHGVPFTGRFTIFSHHIAKDAKPGDRLLHLGLLAHNPGQRPITLKRLVGASYRSQPDALFRPLDPFLPDPDGRIYAGPADRVATELAHAMSPLVPTTWTIPAGKTVLIGDIPVPTSVAILPPVNGSSTLIRCEASGPVHVAEVALFAKKAADGRFLPPKQADFEAILASNRLAGPRDQAAVAFDPNGPAPKGFRYGRVSGVSVGDRWVGTLAAELADLAIGQRVGVPIASVYLNRLGTGQNQSAAMKSRYPDTAYQGHGNYFVTYDLGLDLANPDATPRTYTLALSHPLRVVGEQPATAAVYADAPQRPYFFRGPIRLRWREADGREFTRYSHVALFRGEEGAPFERHVVPARTTRHLDLSVLYAGDNTPTQLLTIARP